MRSREIVCEYQPYIVSPPVSSQQLRDNSVRNDKSTIDRWEPVWLKNIRANKEKVRSFADFGLGDLFGKYLHRPVILAGSGPSLKYNVDKLKDRKGIPLISCLHNFHYFEDRGIAPEYYVTLDAGPVTIEEVSEGGTKTEEEYWELTKNRTLVAFIGTDPDLISKWQGKIHFYNCPIPRKEYQEAVDKIEHFHAYMSTGGNVLGAALYLAKCYLGAGATIFVGADFCFGYDNKFHGWDSKYDAHRGFCVDTYDVFGHKVQTWQSYKNFKDWFDWVAINVPGIYINCTEGGTMGAYQTGNLAAFRIMDLADCISMYSMSAHHKRQALQPGWNGDLRLGMTEQRNADLKGYNYVMY